MRSISFDNPLWLLLLIPLALGVAIPWLISIRRENRSRSAVASLVIHVLIVLLAVLSVAGFSVTTLITETEIYVVADVSYSSARELERTDAYISELSATLPKGARLGVVCFGKDQVLHTKLGEAPTPVSGSEVDSSATDIASALDYTGELFSDGVLKRIVLITDGADTVSDSSSAMIGAVERLAASGVAIDAVFLDANVTEGITEVQLSGADFTPETYLNHDTSLDVLVQASTDMRAVISLYRGGEKLTDRAAQLNSGFNVINLGLPTDTEGSFDYEVTVSAEGDISEHNNAFSFTQTVSADVNVLLITSSADDVRAAHRIFGEGAKITAHFLTSSRSAIKALREEMADAAGVNVVDDPYDVPVSTSELCLFDEIMISGTDVRELGNVSAFLSSCETVVSQYGKTLVTFGDNQIQNKTDDTLESLENMLPVRFGNSAQDPKLFAIVIDTSRSMYTASRLSVAKQAAIHLLSLLSDDDEVIVVSFAGDIKIIQSVTKAVNRQDIAKKINEMKPTQGTSIAGGLRAALDMLLAHDNDSKEVMLISDGMNYTAEVVEIDGVKKSASQLAAYMWENDIAVSTMNPYNSDTNGINTLTSIATSGGGNYYYVQSEKALEDLIFSDIADELTESVVLGESVVRVELGNDEVMEGITYLPSVYGYVHSKAKVSATTPLTVSYTKASGAVVQVPLYSYWSYGNGSVASFTGALSGDWASAWAGESGTAFFEGVFRTSVPEERISCPYTVSTEFDGIYESIEIIPAVLDPFATVKITLTSPSGAVSEYTLTLDASRYLLRYEVPELGKYAVSVTYSSRNGEYTSGTYFHVPYSPEYDAFVSFDPSTLHAAIRHRGTVSEERLPDISNNEDMLASMKMTFTVPFMIAAVALFVVDIIIRKIKWRDIVSLIAPRAEKQ